MEHEKSFTYTLILGVCVNISLLLIGKMLLAKPVPTHTPQSGQSQNETSQTKQPIYLSDAALTTLLQAQLSADVPISDLSIATSQNGTMTLTGTVQKSTLSQIPDLPVSRALLQWMPNEFPITLKLAFAFVEDDLNITIESVDIAGFSLPSSIIPQDFFSAYSESITATLKTQCDFGNIQLVDGGLQLYPK